MQQVIIDIENGTPEVKVKCVKGADCKRLTRNLEAALGDVQKSTPTSEMYEQAKQANQIGR